MIKILVYEVGPLNLVYLCSHTDIFQSDYEVSLLRLLERITNGTVIEINVTGMPLIRNPVVVSNKIF